MIQVYSFCNLSIYTARNLSVQTIITVIPHSGVATIEATEAAASVKIFRLRTETTAAGTDKFHTE